MSAGNWFETRRAAHNLREREVTTAYTVRTGGSTYNFVVDRVITIPTATSAFTVTVPDGEFRGQRLLVVVTKTGTMANTVHVTTGTDNYHLRYARDYVSLEWIGSGDKGWIYLNKSAT